MLWPATVQPHSISHRPIGTLPGVVAVIRLELIDWPLRGVPVLVSYIIVLVVNTTSLMDLLVVVPETTTDPPGGSVTN